MGKPHPPPRPNLLALTRFVWSSLDCMPRILHIIDSLEHTGVAHQLLLLADGLVRAGFDVHIAELCTKRHGRRGERTARTQRSYSGESPVSVTNLGRRFAIDPLADARLLRYVARLQPDVIHTWDTVPGMLAPLACRKRPRLIAGYYHIDRWRPAWHVGCERCLACQVTQFVSNTAAAREWFAQHRLPAQRLVVIPPAAAAPASDVARDTLLRELLLPGDARLIGVVGRLVPEKRVRDLIWAADLLRVLHDNLRMLIIGDGPLRIGLEQYARLASDLDHIRFLGERDDVWRIMPHLDVLWNGGEDGRMSIAMLEAMAVGVPVVASDVPANRELVMHGETGFLVPLGSRAGRADRARYTDRIFKDTGLAARLASAALGLAESQFGAQQFVQQYQKSYLIGEASRSWP